VFSISWGQQQQLLSPTRKYGPLMDRYTWMNLCNEFDHIDDIEFLEWKSQCWWNQHVWMMKGSKHGWN
jgi:hypothetical protein